MFVSRVFGSRSRVITEVLAEAEGRISSRDKVADMLSSLAQVDFGSDQGTKMSDLVDFTHMCARLHKLAKPSSVKDKRASRDLVDSVSPYMDLAACTPSELARYTWACATVGVTPLMPSHLVAHFPAASLSDKDLCTIIWSLSRCLSRSDVEGSKTFAFFLQYLTPDRLARLSDEDLVAISRAAALVYSRSSYVKFGR